jgi:hypothetical protein
MIERIMSEAKILNLVFARLEIPKHKELERVNERMHS